ncbi:signal transduction histidine kinase [Neorhizobium sp. JUb45]|nr:signal transduction histidine kinase [Neorhizobium sp. JUb45]
MAWSLNRNSLKLKLVLHFALVFIVFMIIVSIGFFNFLLGVVPSTNSADYRALPVIAASIASEGGRLVVRETEELRAVKNGSSLWFIVLGSDGARVSFGTMPAAFDSVLASINDIRSLDVRGEDGAAITATLRETDSPVGQIRVLYGGKTPSGSSAYNLGIGLRIVFIPYLVVPLILVALALPLIVGRALAGVKKATRRASEIDANSLGVRLSTNGVVVELHPLVNAINSALARIDGDLTERQRFFANAAHELRTPIAILQTRLEALPAGSVKDRLLMDVGRLAATAEQLLDMQRFANIQSLGEVDLVSLCETVAADFAPIAISAGYELEFDAEVKSFKVNGDHSALERAVTNLVRNAIEHGGGQGRIHIEVLKDGTVEVADEGPGIPEPEREKVFEPFHRTKPKSTGAGLGLSLVHQIVQSHRGHISIIEQNTGARFRLKL